MAMFSGETHWFVEFLPTDGDGNVVPVRLGTTEVVTASDGDPVSALFEARLLTAPQFAIDGWRDGLLGGLIRMQAEPVAVGNPLLADGVSRPLDDLRELYWSRTVCRVWSANGPAFRGQDGWVLVFTGRAGTPAQDGDVLRIPILDSLEPLSEAVRFPRYLGIGPYCLRTTTTGTATTVTPAGTPAWAVPAPSFTFECLIRPRAIATTNQRLCRVGTGSSAGAMCRLSPSAGNEGKLQWVLPEVTVTTGSLTSTLTLANGDPWTRLSFVLTGATAKIYVWRMGIDDRPQLWVSATFTGTVTYTTARGVLQTTDLDVLSWRVLSSALTADQIAADAWSLRDSSDSGVLIELPCTDGTGAVTLANTFGSAATVANHAWTWSGEGDESLAGQPKPVLLGGAALNLSPVLVSEPHRVYQIATRRPGLGAALASSPVVRERGGVLVLGSGGGTNYREDLTEGTIEIHTLSAAAGQIHVDATATATQSLGQIVTRLMDDYGPPEIALDATALAAGPAAYMELWTREDRSLATILDELASGAGVWLISNEAGELGLIQPDVPTAAAALGTLRERWDVSDARAIGAPRPPSLRQRVRYATNYTPTPLQDVPNASTAIRQWVEEEGRFAVAELSSDLRDLHPDATEPETLRGHFVNRAPARTLAKDRQAGILGLDGVAALRVSHTLPPAGLAIGTVWILECAALGWVPTPVLVVGLRSSGASRLESVVIGAFRS